MLAGLTLSFLTLSRQNKNKITWLKKLTSFWRKLSSLLRDKEDKYFISTKVKKCQMWPLAGEY